MDPKNVKRNNQQVSGADRRLAAGGNDTITGNGAPSRQRRALPDQAAGSRWNRPQASTSGEKSRSVKCLCTDKGKPSNPKPSSSRDAPSVDTPTSAATPEIIHAPLSPNEAVPVMITCPPTCESNKTSKTTESADQCAQTPHCLWPAFEVSCLELTREIEDASRLEARKQFSNMMSVAISTVMTLAYGQFAVSNEHLEWTRKFLDLIRDEEGRNPRNISGILWELNNNVNSAGDAPTGQECTDCKEDAQSGEECGVCEGCAECAEIKKDKEADEEVSSHHTATEEVNSHHTATEEVNSHHTATEEVNSRQGDEAKDLGDPVEPEVVEEESPPEPEEGNKAEPTPKAKKKCKVCRIKPIKKKMNNQ